MRIAAIAAALVIGISSAAFAQGGGASGANASSATGGVNDTAPSTTGQNSKANNMQDQATSPTEHQQQRNRGFGTAPNGLPVGAPGSGLGSPEQPHDAGARMR